MMNSMLARHRLFSLPTGVLDGGKAPRFWQRELSRENDRLLMVLRNCRWLDELTKVNPCISQPLFGNCLVELTSCAGPHSDPAKAEAPQSATHFNQPAPRSRERDRKTPERTMLSKIRRQPRIDPSETFAAQDVAESSRTRGGRRGVLRFSSQIAASEPFQPRDVYEKVSRRPSPVEGLPLSQHRGQSAKVFQLPPRAEGSLLNRFAGVVLGISRVREKATGQVSLSARRRPGSSSPILTPSLREREWRQSIASRAARTLLRTWQSLTEPAPGASAWPKMPLQNSARAVLTSARLDEEWMTPVSGGRASAELLDQLVKPVEVVGIRSNPETRRTTSENPETNRLLSVPSVSSGPVAPALERPSRINTQQNFASTKSERIFSESGQHLLTQEIDRGFIIQPDHQSTTNQQPSSNLAPPALSPALPPLLPPASPGSAAVPQAANTVRYGAWRDEVGAQETDLSRLAVQIKRILDEEARRHGIDV
jgi:hypothetical protein